MSDREAVDLQQKFGAFQEHWRPKVAASWNEQELKLVKIQGGFPWHSHADVDELFFGWRGHFRLEFRDRIVDVAPGQVVVVPHGVEHRPVAEQEAEILLIEPAGVRNTGDMVDEQFTAPNGVSI